MGVFFPSACTMSAAGARKAGEMSLQAGPTAISMLKH